LELTGHWWLTPVILTTQEAEIRRIEVQSQPGQTVHWNVRKKFTCPNSKTLEVQQKRDFNDNLARLSSKQAHPEQL
jgi:hypothetical protein